MASSGSDGKETTTTMRQLLTIAETLISLSSSNPPPPPVDSLPDVSLLTLPFDLVLEILFRLPVKKLVQLRCLCKSWNSLISNPKFARKHLSFSRTLPTRHHLILVRRDWDSEGEFHLWDSRLSSVFNSTSIIPETELRYPLNVPKFHDMIIGTCDGIICFTTSDDYSSFLVWNPSINKIKISPPLEIETNYHTVSGFGYDHFNDAYKVVVVCVYKKDTDRSNWVCKTQVNVHTFGTNSWRRIQDFPIGIPRLDSGKFVSGAINWLASTDSNSWDIVSLDLGNESYQEISQPNYGEVAVQQLTLGVLRDCLCIISHFDNFWDVWVMKDYGNKVSWTKLFSISSGVVGYKTAFPCYAHYISLDDQLLLDLFDEVAVYNSKDGTSKIPEIQYIHSDYFNTDVYIESLISP